MKKLRERYSCKDLRYANTSRTQVILPSYKELFRGQTTRRVKKKKEMHICTKYIGKLQLKVEKYESTEDRSYHQDKRRRRFKMAEHRRFKGWHAVVRSPETSMH